MKKYGYGILIVLIALSFAATGVALAFMPDIVPVHYNFAGEVDRFGSKFEYLIFPAIAAVTGVIIALTAWCCGKMAVKESALAEKISLWSGIFEVLLFSGLELYFMWKAAHYAPGDVGPTFSADLLKIVGIGSGLLFILLGNFMPKARRNAFYGLRTKWSMANDEVWQKSQRFGGISAVAFGFLLIVAGIFMDGVGLMILCMVLTAVWVVLCVGMSYRFYKQEGK